jgi:arylsulfatase A-like enzyme
MLRTDTRLAGAAGHRLTALLAALACAAAPLAAGAAAKAEGNAKQPNILMIMTDDLDMQVFQSALQAGYLPNIQREIVAKSTNFAETFVALPMCCPSRTSYLTGQYPHNHGIYRNVGSHGGFESFAKDGSTLAVWLHAAGYRTGLVGKYLNGYGTTPKAEKGKYIPPGWDTWDALFTVGQYNYNMSQNGNRHHYGADPQDYQTDVLAGLAQTFLSRTKTTQPFFLTLTPTAPHYEGSDDDDDSGGGIRPPVRYLDTPPLAQMPMEGWPSFNEADMSDKPAWMRDDAPVDPVGQRSGFNSKIAAMRAVDDMVGTAIAELEKVGKLDQTLIIFTSDNGFQYGTHRRTQKTDMYEESIRVPLYIRAPGQTQAITSHSWAMNIDWAPTIVDFANATTDIAMDGQSLRPWVGGDAGAPAGRRTVLIEHPCDGSPMKDHPPYDMIRSMDPALTGDQTGQTVMIYAETYNPKNVLTDREFYNLATDPYQDESEASSSNPHVVSAMNALSTRLAQLKTCVGSQCRALQK